MMYWLVGIIGFVIGELTGIALMCLMVTTKDGDLRTAYRHPHNVIYKMQGYEIDISKANVPTEYKNSLQMIYGRMRGVRAMKAILEMDMPENCHNCVLSTRPNKIFICAAYERIVDITDEVNNYRKNIGCPLKEVEDK